MPSDNEGLLYDMKDIQKKLGIGRTKTYAFLHEVYVSKEPFPVLKIGTQYRIPKKPFDDWIAGK